MAENGISFVFEPPPDLPELLAARSTCTDPVDRHFLLQNIVRETYRRRSDPDMRQLCIETGLTHLEEIPSMAPALRAEFRDSFQGDLPEVPSFAWLATALAEDGRVDEALLVCRRAADFGLRDGTKSGYRGRAERLSKKYSRQP